MFKPTHKFDPVTWARCIVAENGVCDNALKRYNCNPNDMMMGPCNYCQFAKGNQCYPVRDGVWHEQRRQIANEYLNIELIKKL